jgi:hypothetical protein
MTTKRFIWRFKDSDQELSVIAVSYSQAKWKLAMKRGWWWVNTMLDEGRISFHKTENVDTGAKKETRAQFFQRRFDEEKAAGRIWWDN